LSEHGKVADDLESKLLQTGATLSEIVQIAVHQTLEGVVNQPDKGWTTQLAELAYAYACLEGARRGVLPSHPPSGKSAQGGPLNDILGADSGRRSSGSPQFGDPSRVGR
jgi:hypothetical protein